MTSLKPRDGAFDVGVDLGEMYPTRHHEVYHACVSGVRLCGQCRHVGSGGRRAADDLLPRQMGSHEGHLGRAELNVLDGWVVWLYSARCRLRAMYLYMHQNLLRFVPRIQHSRPRRRKLTSPHTRVTGLGRDIGVDTESPLDRHWQVLSCRGEQLGINVRIDRRGMLVRLVKDLSPASQLGVHVFMLRSTDRGLTTIEWP
jgi:hypothetical protein